MRRKLLIHIGTHKTATTSIQGFLQSQRDRLARSGIYIPTSGTLHELSGHHNIAWRLRNDERMDPAQKDCVEALFREIAGIDYGTVVLSSEDFEYMAQYPEELRRFDSDLRGLGFDTDYVVFFRNRDDYAVSLYNASVRWGLTASFAEFRADIERNGFFRMRGDWYYNLDYPRFLAEWKGILGKDLIAFSYDEAAQGEGVVPTFMRCIGAPADLVTESAAAPVLNRWPNSANRYVPADPS